MKTLKRIGIILLAIIALLVVGSFFLSSKSHVERSIIINASDSLVFDKVNNLKNFITWMPWAKKDPAIQMEFFGGEKGLGQGYTWRSNKSDVGNGKMTIVQSTPNTVVVMEMDFEGMGKSGATFTLNKEAEGTKITWALDSNGEGMPAMLTIPHKYMSLFMGKMVGPDFELGLNNLKAACEVN
jgi:hypothetical protein